MVESDLQIRLLTNIGGGFACFEEEERERNLK